MLVDLIRRDEVGDKQRMAAGQNFLVGSGNAQFHVRVIANLHSVSGGQHWAFLHHVGGHVAKDIERLAGEFVSVHVSRQIRQPIDVQAAVSSNSNFTKPA